MVSGEWSKLQIDHINGVKTDNRWVNLREATHSQNQCNIALQKNNTSGFKGVNYDRRRDKWIAWLGIAGQSLYLGGYDTKEEAYRVVCAKREKEHKHFAHNGDFC